MSQIPCKYHPKMAAITSCERCHRPICLNDKMIYRVQRSRGSSNSRYYWTEKYEYCPLCYYEAEIENSTGSAAVAGRIFIIIFLIVFITLAGFGFRFMFNGVFSDDYFGPPIGFVIPFTIIFFSIPLFGLYSLIKEHITAPQRAENARQAQQDFLQSLDHIPKGIENNIPPDGWFPGSKNRKLNNWSRTILTCFECGSEIHMSDRYCLNCGDSTSDEVQFAKKRT